MRKILAVFLFAFAISAYSQTVVVGGGGGGFSGGAISGATSFADGTQAAPSVRMTNDAANIGWFRLTSDAGWGFSAGNTLAVGFSSTGAPGMHLYTNGFISIRNGAAQGSGTSQFWQHDATNNRFLVRGSTGTMKQMWVQNFTSLTQYAGVEIAATSTQSKIRAINQGAQTVVPLAVWTGVSTNSDMAGSVTLSGGTGTYTFLDTYATAPICVATDTTAANAVKVTTSTTTLTLTGTTTDVINYICVPRT